MEIINLSKAVFGCLRVNMTTFYEWQDLQLVSVIRPRRSRSTAAYSDQTFPWTICRWVSQSSALWKMADMVLMPIFRTGPHLALATCAGLAQSVGRSRCGIINSPATTFTVVIKQPHGTLSQRRDPLPKLLWVDLLQMSSTSFLADDMINSWTPHADARSWSTASSFVIGWWACVLCVKIETCSIISSCNKPLTTTGFALRTASLSLRLALRAQRQAGNPASYIKCFRYERSNANVSAKTYMARQMKSTLTRLLVHDRQGYSLALIRPGQARRCEKSTRANNY